MPALSHVDDGALSATEITRAILGAAIGYTMFAGAGLLFFALAGRDPRAHHELGFILLAMLVGAPFAALAGYVCVGIAGRAARSSMFTLAGLIAAGAAMLLMMRPGEGNVWSELMTLVVFAPAAIAGGLTRLHQARGMRPVRRDRP